MFSKHPAALNPDAFLADCRFTTTRRGGPGGQNRNKVETAVVVEHLPTSIRAEANEKRTQGENRTAAFQRLRIAVAIQHRTVAPESLSEDSFHPTAIWARYINKGRILVSDSNPDFPAILAEFLDLLSWHQDDLTAVAKLLSVSQSQLVKLLKLEPLALTLFNQRRKLRGEHPLR